MRKEAYNKILREGIERLKADPTITTLADKKIEAFNTILNETKQTNLDKYYRNMDEFYGAGMTDIILIDPHYILTNTPHLCNGDNCTFETVEEANEVSEEPTQEELHETLDKE